MLRWLLFIALTGVPSVFGASLGQEDSISLAGSWRFRLDPKNIGIEKRWFTEKLDDSVTLPGTTDTNQKGVFKDERAVDRLSRVWYWKGPAWYQREVVIPESWKGKRITLLLERTKNTRVWVDDKDCGAEDTLSALQIFDLTRAMTPGGHVITVLVDNAKLPPVGPAHAVDERTQSNWNGISEHYDSVTGKALGVPDYCMSSTLVTMMLDGLARKYKLKLRDKKPTDNEQ